MALRWFRLGKKQEEGATEQVVPQEQEAPPEQEAVAVSGAEDAPETPKKKRRRGARGGRGRKKKATPSGGAEQSAEDASEEKPEQRPVSDGSGAPEPSKRQQERKQDRRSARSGRRRTATKRAALPPAKRDLLITVDVGEQRVAILEDDVVAEVYLERPERRSIAGNIYLGTVDNVLPGMEAAFVEIGLEKNGFLYVDEIVGPELEGRKGARRIQDLIKRGQTILVQAVKDPMKTKGARLTTEISLPGRFLVYVPNGEGSGVSRRLEDAERTRLKEIVRNLDPKGGGIIVRTAAEGASAEDIERDLVFLQRLWKNIQTRAKSVEAPALVYEEAELPLRIVRDLFAGDFVGAQIDDDRTHRRIVNYLKKTSPHMVERVHRFREKESLFEAYGVDAAIRSTLDRRVDLPSGGYLIFDYAEAFTVIDVNTGRFVGQRGKSAQGRLEDTIVKNNLEAVKEVVRQLRLRDIGGIIVIDFIDMANPKNRETVEDALRAELERDRTKTYVVEISPLGLVEMTRQNVTDGPREILTNRCPVCSGDGFVVSDATFALDVERKLRAIAKGARAQAFRVEVHPRILELLAGAGGQRLAAVEAASRRRFFLVPASGNGHVHVDHFEVIAHGKLDAIRPETPVEDGASLSLKLVEVGLYDAAAGVGKVGDYEIVVAGAAKLVGKKVQVTVGRALENGAFATLAGTAQRAEPITFEAEAEKPPRSQPRKSAAAESAVEADAGRDDAARGLEPPPDVDTIATAESDLVAEAKSEAPDEADEPLGDGEEAAPKKKRTRRGSRGGRGRKKAAGTPTAEAEPRDGSGDGRPDPRVAAPRIHVPPAGLGSPDADAPAAGAVSSPGASPVEASDETEAGGADLGDADRGEIEPGEAGEAGAPAEAGADAEPKRKRSRRGSRGGRRRRKPSADGAAASGESGEADGRAVAAGEREEADDHLVGTGESPEREPALPEPGREPQPEPVLAEAAPGYVPMSDWIGDFEPRDAA